MRIARRYRAALRAYPPGYRRSRGPELLATLADGDDDRGRPSMREAAALTYRGLTMRAHVAASPDGLLAASAALVLLAVLGWFDWAGRVFLFHGKPAALASDGPGWWLTLALARGAYLVLAAGPFRAAEDPRRRRAAVLLAFPLALAAFTAPGRIFYAGVPDWDTLVEFVKWSPAAVFHNWPLTLPAAWERFSSRGSPSQPCAGRVLLPGSVPSARRSSSWPPWRLRRLGTVPTFPPRTRGARSPTSEPQRSSPPPAPRWP